MDIKRNPAPAWLLGGILVLATSSGMAAEGEVTAEQVVTALENTFGVHPGERRNHTKGTCAAGEFVGAAEARAYTRSVLFSGETVPVIARFSMPGGNPRVPDTARTPRGMALEFRLPDGGLQHMTMLNTPVFGAATPRTFFNDIVAKTPDPATGKPDPEKIKAFRARHPDTVPQAEFLARNNPPVSWANSSYFGIHSFRFVNADNETTLVRWRFVPQDGERQMSDAELEAAPPDFLEQKLIERTRYWPAEREEIKVGTLTISSATPQKGAECEGINFDPLVMSDGIEPTDDPVLRFRSPAYAVSFGKRQSGR